MSGRRTKNRRELVEAEPVRVEVRAAPTEAPRVAAQPLALLLLLLAGSGCAALVYEVVWFQLLQLVIGSSAVSLGLLLAAYMGGLCLGSAALSRVAPTTEHPLRIYAFLELGIGAFGIIALFGVPLVGHLYLLGPTSGLAGIVVRGVVAAACLLPPTVLMGASFPAVARSLGTNSEGISRMGLLYSANIAGAVVGSVMAGFWLLRLYDMAVATYAAAAINIAMALLAFNLVKKFTHRAGEVPDRAVRYAPGAAIVYGAIAFSGMSALGAEVVWTRLLSLLLGPTVYTFSIILAVFLVGLWGGSTAGSYVARRVGNPRMALAVTQILLAVTIAFTAWTLAYALPNWPVDPWLSTNPWFNFDLDVARCVRAILPATLLWGAAFPLALAAAAGEGEDPARLSGEVYAANTAGSIVGALAFSLLLIPAIGTKGSQQLLIWLAVAGAALALLAASRKIAVLAVAIGGAAVLAVALGSTVATIPWPAIAYGRRIAPILKAIADAGSNPATPLFIGEGINSSVVITESSGVRGFYVSGKSEASSGLIDMRLQRLMGHLPALISSQAQGDPKSVLVVGFGAGVTAGSFVPYPDVERISICELEPIIPPASDQYFGNENYHVLRDARTRIVYDDARHYIAASPDKFDIITTDPIHPWVKGTSTLYSREYYQLVKEHLNPGGVVAQWLPIYESDRATVATELATFFDVFSNASVWTNYLNGDGYDLVLLGRMGSSPIDVDRMQRLLDRPSYAAVAASLNNVQFGSATDLMGTYVGRAEDLQPMIAGAPINDDLNLRLQYIAGMGVNSVAAPRIFTEMLSYRKFPEGLLTGSDDAMARLRELLGRRQRSF